MKDNKIDASSEEEDWEVEDNARIIERYFDLKDNPDKYEKALTLIKKRNATLTEQLKKIDNYKEKIGFSKK